MICEARDILRLRSRNLFGGQFVRPDIFRFVSVLAKRPRLTPTMPVRLPSAAEWLLKILSREGRFVFGVCRRHMKVISFPGKSGPPPNRGVGRHPAYTLEESGYE